MRIHHLLDTPSIILSNEEKDFIDEMGNELTLETLNGREQVLARNLVRKGIYEISKDNKHLHLTHAQSPKKFS
jgi:hypothetical protein